MPFPCIFRSCMSCFTPGRRERRPGAEPIWRITPRIELYCFSRSRTSFSVRPEPRAMRFTRASVMTSGRCRSAWVIESTIATIFVSAVSSNWKPSGSSPKSGNFSISSPSGPIFRTSRNLVDEVLEREVAGEDLLGVRLGGLLVDVLLEVLDEADDVAEPEDAGGEPLRPELLELVERLAHAEELDGLARDLLDGERRAAARVAVELREDEAVEGEPPVELGRGLHRVLADHRVGDEEDVLGDDRLLDVLELLHELLVDGEAAGGVVDDDVAFSRAAASKAWRHISGGETPASWKTGTPSFCPRIWSCSTAAGR